MAAVFKALDRDGDGEIDVYEWTGQALRLQTCSSRQATTDVCGVLRVSSLWATREYYSQCAVPSVLS